MFNILIVDDEEMIRKLISKYAAFEGHSFDEAGNGMEAVEKCRQNSYDIVIMDIMMPELDGFSSSSTISILNINQPHSYKVLNYGIK